MQTRGRQNKKIEKPMHGFLQVACASTAKVHFRTQQRAGAAVFYLTTFHDFNTLALQYGDGNFRRKKLR